MKNIFKKIFGKKITYIALSAVVLAAAAAAVIINRDVIFKKAAQPAAVSSDIFWNIDRYQYYYNTTENQRVRAKDKSDGSWHISLCNITQGRKVIRRVKEGKILNELDSYDIFGLQFDSEGIITGVIPIEDMGKQLTLKRGYLTGDCTDGKTLKINTSETGTGLEYTITLPEKTPVYDLVGDTGTIGSRITDGLLDGDCVSILSGEKGVPEAVLVNDRIAVGTLYWNKTRMWNEKLGFSSRKVDDDGYFNFELAANGKTEIYKTRDAEIAKQIDSQAIRTVGLVLEEGNIIKEVLPARQVTKGTFFGTFYNVNKLDGNTVGVIKTSVPGGAEQGKTQSGELAKNCRIYDVTGIEGSTYGAETQLKTGDMIMGFTNARGKVCYIFVHGGRTVKGISLYWNTSRKVTADGTWTRKPDSDGRYVFDVISAEKKQQLKVWTRDAALAKIIDTEYVTPAFGIRLDGDRIVAVYPVGQVTGGMHFASGMTVTSVSGGIVKATNAQKSPVREAEMDKDCIVLSVQRKGAPDKVEVGDRIAGAVDGLGKIKVIFILNKNTNPVKTAYCAHCGKNVMWYRFSSGTSTEDGKHFVMTEDLLSANQYNVGSTSNTLFKYTATENVLDLAGHKFSASGRAIAVQIGCKFTLLDSVGGGIVTTENRTKADTGFGIWVRQLAKCDMRGGTVDLTGFENVAYSGSAVSILGGSVFNMYDGAAIKNGTTVYGTRKNFSDKEVTGGDVGGNVVVSSAGSQTDSSGKKVSYGGAVFNMYGGTISGGKVIGGEGFAHITCKGGNVYISSGAVFNMYGGTVSGGAAAGIGGNFNNNLGTLNILGGTVSGGKALRHKNKSGAFIDGHGGNIYNNGTLNIKGGVIEEGISDHQTYGGGNISSNTDNSVIKMTGGVVRNGFSAAKGEGNIFIWNSPESTFDMSGGTVTNTKTAPDGYFTGGVYYLNGKITLSGNAEITGKNGAVLYIAANNTVTAKDLKEGAKIAVDMKTAGVFAKNAKQYAANFTCARENYAVDTTGEDLQIVYNHFHCICGALPESAADIGDHTTHKKVYYEPLTQADINDKFGGKLPDYGNWFLSENITLKGQASNTGDINLCFNGHTASYPSNGSSSDRMYLLGQTLPDNMTKKGKTEAVISFTDCKNGGGFKKKDAASKAIGAMIIINNKHKVALNIMGGTLDGSETVTNQVGGVIAVNAAGTVNMYGGTIIGATAKFGGSISLSTANTVFNMYGGTVKDGKALQGNTETLGGNIYCAKGSVLNVSGGVISGGKAASGGNIGAAYKETSVTITGGTVSGGRAEKTVSGAGGRGGNLYLNFAPATLSGGVIEKGFANCADGGGNVYIRGGTGRLNVSDTAVVKDGDSAKTEGKNISVCEGGILALYGGKVNGYVYHKNGILNLTKKAYVYGGNTNIYIEDATAKVNVISSLQEGAKIGISMKTPGKFTDSGAAFSGYFVSDKAGLTVKKNGSGLELS